MGVCVPFFIILMGALKVQKLAEKPCSQGLYISFSGKQTVFQKVTSKSLFCVQNLRPKRTLPKSRTVTGNPFSFWSGHTHKCFLQFPAKAQAFMRTLIVLVKLLLCLWIHLVLCCETFPYSRDLFVSKRNGSIRYALHVQLYFSCIWKTWQAVIINWAFIVVTSKALHIKLLAAHLNALHMHCTTMAA